MKLAMKMPALVFGIGNKARVKSSTDIRGFTRTGTWAIFRAMTIRYRIKGQAARHSEYLGWAGDN